MSEPARKVHALSEAAMAPPPASRGDLGLAHAPWGAPGEAGLDFPPMEVAIGPSHPVSHGTVRMMVWLEGETIVASDVQVGYLHRGFEKECESGTWCQVFPYTDRLNYVSAILANIGYALAVEKLIGVKVPERCDAIRVVMGEVSRIADHLTCVGAASLELGAMTAFLYAMEARELLWDLVESACGARVTCNYVRIGGLSADLPEGFAERARANLAKVDSLARDIDKLLTKNRIFVDRMKDTGVLSREDAIAYGVTGPLGRASGLRYDVRKATPYCGYERYDFDCPVGTSGDNYDRYLVRMEEIRQSRRIIDQALAWMPAGPVDIDDPKVRMPGKDRVFQRMEELIHQFKLVTAGIPVPPGEAYASVESANGELGFYVVSDGSGMPVKVRCRPPSFVNMQPIGLMIQGSLLADIIPTFDMVNMIGGECDR